MQPSWEKGKKGRAQDKERTFMEGKKTTHNLCVVKEKKS